MVFRHSQSAPDILLQWQDGSVQTALAVRAATWFSWLSHSDVVSCFCLADAKSLPGISDPFPEIFDPANLLERADGSAKPINVRYFVLHHSQSETVS